MLKRYEDLSGRKFGKLTVIEYAGESKHQKAQWECLCECGNTKIVIAGNLKNRKTKSCGCIHKEQLSRIRKKHGETGSRLYTTWRGMKDRCSNPNNRDFKNYGGRGIEVTKCWFDDFEVFSKWAKETNYNDNLTLERKDPNGNYEPDNCEWIPMSEQSKNRRSNHYITINGETNTIADWSRLSGVDRNTIRRRSERGITGVNLIKKGRL